MTDETRTSLISGLKAEVQEHINRRELTDSELKSLIRQLLANKLHWAERNDLDLAFELRAMNFKDKDGIITTVFDSVRGLGILGQIIADPAVTEVMINGYQDIFVERNHRLIKLDQHFESRQELENIIQKFVSDGGRKVNQGEPIVDTRLEDGSRVSVVLPPIALNGPIVTIRRFPERTYTMDDLVNFGSIPRELADVLRKLVECGYNIFISGGTGSGKTTFLNALSNYIPRDQRVITIEDSAELQIKGIDNLVRLETRDAGLDCNTEISIRRLIKTALRMRPDRIIIGEVRGEEALDMLQAMNTGHDGSLSTGHANSAEDMIKRLETMVLQGTSGMPLEAIRQQIQSAVDIIIHLARMRDKTRKVVEIAEVGKYDPDTRQIELRPLYQFRERGTDRRGMIIGGLERTGLEMNRTGKLRNAHVTLEI